MTTYLVHRHQSSHTCPGDPHPHTVYTRQTIIGIIPGGSCHTPVTIRLADTTTVIACGRRYPTARQCPACRITITIQHLTTNHLGEQPAHVPPAPTGLAPHPCAVCRQPLAAVLAESGHHVLCHPRVAIARHSA